MHGLIKEYGLMKIVKAGVAEMYRKIWREILYGSYSQNWEDIAIEKILGKKRQGFYLEIGAYHPTRLSNTYRFYKNGWRGVVVEPNPAVKSLFKRIRPEDLLVTAGVGKKAGEMNYYKYLIPALNTFSVKQKRINQINGYKVWQKEKIEIIPISKLLKKYVGGKKIDLLSIDTEGWDEIILNNWAWKYKPRIICTESKRVKKYLMSKGYEIKFENQANTIYEQK